ncbi:sigma-70 family RNA polymerase sigma factor [Actinoplanes sp. HUAS TT8]|uniref:sigma-70 family RNA polymerase sigma factor n=1 Tax=Actinoplanes sp. HUAS TT8 TaxID=3447453 RepID=UPI003F521CE3
MTSTLSDPVSRMEEVHALHGRPLLHFLLRLTRNERSVAEDLFQETMLRAWKHMDTLPVQEENARRWLFTVARRIAIDAARMRQARPSEVNLLDASSLLSEEDSTEQSLAVFTLSDALGRLSWAHRTILHELYWKGASTDETAARLGVPVGTVKSRAHYALRHLRAAFGMSG